MPVPSPRPQAEPAAFSADELAVVRRAYARQMLAILDVDHPAIAAAFAAVPRERFLGPPPWFAFVPFAGYRQFAGADPVVLYQDLVVSLNRARGVNNGSPSLHARLLSALDPGPGDHVVHLGAATGYYSAILAEMVGPDGLVTAVEFDADLAARAADALAERKNVRVVRGDGALWPDAPADGVYVNFAVSRPADRWIENLAPGSRLVFPLGVPGPQRLGSSSRHSDRGAALRVERQGEAFAARFFTTAFFVCAEGGLVCDPDEEAKLRTAFDAGSVDTVRSLVWKRPAPPENCWFAGADWALCREEPQPNTEVPT